MTSKTSTSYRLSKETLDNIEWLRVRQGKKSGKAVIESVINELVHTLRGLDTAESVPVKNRHKNELARGSVIDTLSRLGKPNTGSKEDLKVEYDED